MECVHFFFIKGYSLFCWSVLLKLVVFCKCACRSTIRISLEEGPSGWWVRLWVTSLSNVLMDLINQGLPRICGSLNHLLGCHSDGLDFSFFFFLLDFLMGGFNGLFAGRATVCKFSVGITTIDTLGLALAFSVGVSARATFREKGLFSALH